MAAGERLTGTRKAAILLMAVGPDVASALLRRLPREEVDAIMLEVANMRRVDPKLQDEVLVEFEQMKKAATEITEGGLELAREILERAFDAPRANEILHRLTSFLQSRPLEVLRKTDPAQITQFLQGEHPQTVAVLLAHMDPVQASQVLSALPPEEQSDVARRIALLERVPPEVIRDLENLLEKKFSNLAVSEMNAVGGLNAIVPILNNTDRSSERAILTRLGEVDPDLAEEIKSRMFVFENIVLLDDRAVQKVLRRVDNKTLAMAIKGTPPDVADKIFRNLSQKAQELLKDDIEVLGPVRIRDVEKAQREIVGIIRALEDQGEIVISRGERDEFVS